MPRLRTAPLERTPLLDALPTAGAVRVAGTRAEGMARVKAFVALTKPRIIELLLVTTIPTMFVARRGTPGLWLMVATLLGGTLAAGGANAINMVVDRDIDRLMERTKNRPLVTGALEPREALIFAIVIEALAFAWLTVTVNLLSAVLAVCACLFYVFVYTLWLKRTSRQNIVIGGAAGAVPVLVGWSAVTNSLSWSAWLLFAIMFLWTPPHFWALAVKYREDYKAADVPMLPVVASFNETANQIVAYTVVMVGLTFALGPVAHLGWVYLGTAIVTGVLFLAGALTLRRIGRAGEPTAKPAMRLFGYSITYVTVLFAAMALDQVI